MALIDVLRRSRTVGAEFTKFLISPGRFVVHWKNSANTRSSTKEVMGWSIAASFVVISLYGLSFDSLGENVEKAFGYISSQTDSHTAAAGSSAGIRDINWKFGFGVGVLFPEAPMKGLDRPQVADFTMGGVTVRIGPVVPNDLPQKTILTLMLILYALVTSLCLHMPARLLGGIGQISEAIRLSILYYFYTFLFAVVLSTICGVVLINILSLTGNHFFATWMLLVVLPLSVVVFRGFFASFSEFYMISKMRVFFGGLGSMTISWIVSPIVFVPGVYLILKLKPVWDLIL